MFLLAHLAAGLIIGKLTQNYLVALIAALFVDIDHLIPYIKHKVIFNLKKFWKTITNPKDPYGGQRNYLHSIFGFILVSLIVFLFDQRIGIVFSLGYLSHLLLDVLDNSDFYPFYPIKEINIKGPVKYFSKAEFALTLILFIIFFIV